METTKKKLGRPVGKRINWAKIGPFRNWKNMTNSRIAEVCGTSVMNAFLKRKRLAAEGKDVACLKPKWTRVKGKATQKKTKRVVTSASADVAALEKAA